MPEPTKEREGTPEEQRSNDRMAEEIKVLEERDRTKSRLGNFFLTLKNIMNPQKKEEKKPDS